MSCTTPTKMLLAMMVLMGCGGTESARILGLFATPAKSHCRVFEALFQGLAARGHEVTFASPVGLQWPSRGSVEEVIFSAGDAIGPVLSQVVSPQRNPFSESLALWKVAPEICRHELMAPSVQKLIHAGKNHTMKFDLVIVESFFFDCFVPFAKLYDAPLVLFTSQWAPKWAQLAMGNADPWATSPYMFLPYTHQMSFWQRLHNVLLSAGTVLARSMFYIHHQNQVVQEIFGEEYASIEEQERKAALLLVNSHPITNSPHANLPNVIEVGGIHLTPAKQLDKELVAYLEKASTGVILFSLGSLISKDNMDPERLNTLTEAMGQLKEYSILWRWDTDKVPNLPTNVKIMPWIPQRDILAHPKVLLFVTHGGLLSAQEATYEGVPRVVMPFFGDQQMNAQKVFESGVGLALNYYSAKSQEIADVIRTVLTDESFSIKAKELSAAFRDELDTPLDRAVFWTEYVIKHRSANPLRSASADLLWYENMCLDIFAFLFALFTIVILVTYKCLSILLTISCNSKQKED